MGGGRRIWTEHQESVVGQQDCGRRRAPFQHIGETAHRHVRSARSPGNHGDVLGLSEAQHRLGAAGQRAVGHGEGGRGRRVGVDDRAHMGAGLVHGAVHGDDLGADGLQLTFQDLSVETHGRQLFGPQAADEPRRQQKALTVKPGAQIGVP